GAMENPGLITCAEPLVLIKPDESAIAARREYASVMTHEMAHQWFGDLVTMAWWDDVWLNESFATWMTDKIVGEWKPAWKIDVDQVRERGDALDRDSVASAPPLRAPARTHADLERGGGRLVYTKGASVLRMFEAWLGADVFQRGIRHYLEQH